MKKTLLTIIISGIVFTSIGATAAYIYTANDIGYQPTDTEWNVNNVGQAINDIKTDINNINDLVEQGDMLYPEGTSIVGLVSDDTPYKDSNDKYILADSTTGKNMIDNVTYKSISSTETLKGSVGADTASTFSSLKMDLLWTNPSQPGPACSVGALTIPLDLSNYDAIKVLYVGQGNYVEYDMAYYGVALAKVGTSIPLGGRLNNNANGGGRNITVSSSGVSVSSGAQTNSEDSWSPNTYGIPLKIWGIKSSPILDDLLATN